MTNCIIIQRSMNFLTLVCKKFVISVQKKTPVANYVTLQYLKINVFMFEEYEFFKCKFS